MARRIRAADLGDQRREQLATLLASAIRDTTRSWSSRCQGRARRSSSPAWSSCLSTGPSATARVARPPSLRGDRPRFSPSKPATLVVALLLAASAVVVVGAVREWDPPLLFEVGGAGLAAVLLARSIGDRRSAGLLKRGKDTDFARRDTWRYSPLCLAVAMATMAVALSRQPRAALDGSGRPAGTSWLASARGSSRGSIHVRHGLEPPQDRSATLGTRTNRWSSGSGSAMTSAMVWPAPTGGRSDGLQVLATSAHP